jgi:hypothetical protein
MHCALSYHPVLQFPLLTLLPFLQKVEDTKLRRERKAQQDKIRNQQKSAAAAAGKVVAGGSEVTANGAGGAESSVPETTSGTTTATAASTAVVEEEAPKAKRMGNRELKVCHSRALTTSWLVDNIR